MVLRLIILSVALGKVIGSEMMLDGSVDSNQLIVYQGESARMAKW